MLLFAQLSSDNLVSQLIPVSEVNAPDEASGVAYIQKILGSGNFVLANTTSPIRREVTRLGSYFDPVSREFYRPIRTDNPTAPDYINLPNGTSYCMIFRNGSSLITGLIKKTYFSPEETTGQSVQNIRGLPMAATPTGEAHAVLRDPVDRFVSAYALQTGGVPCWLGVDDFIAWIGQQDPATINRHFRKQTLLIGSPAPEKITYHDFQSVDFNQLAETLGLPTPVEVVNKTNPSKKPKLTKAQIASIQSLYPEDMELYGSISTPSSGLIGSLKSALGL